MSNSKNQNCSKVRLLTRNLESYPFFALDVDWAWVDHMSLLRTTDIVVQNTVPTTGTDLLGGVINNNPSKAKPILSSLTMPARSNIKLIHGWPKIWIHWMKMSVPYSLSHRTNLFQISGRTPKLFQLAPWQVEMIHHLVVVFDQSVLVCLELLVHSIKNNFLNWWPLFATQIQTLSVVSFQITIRDQVLLHHILSLNSSDAMVSWKVSESVARVSRTESHSKNSVNDMKFLLRPSSVIKLWMQRRPAS